MLLPASAPVMSPEDLPSARAEVDLLRVLRVDRHAEGRAAGVSPPVKAVPGFSQASRPHETALCAAEVPANTGIERVGVVGSDLHAPRIHDGGGLFDVQ